MADVFAAAKIPSAQKWSATKQGQHIELGIAENNLFLMLAALGLAATCSARGCSRSARSTIPSSPAASMRSTTPATRMRASCWSRRPSGVTLGPEGGAHQSINPPLIALGQPGLRHYEPAFADELAAMMEEAFRLIDEPDGESVYLRLTTRTIAQVERDDDGWKAGALAGGYWLREPGAGAEAAIVLWARSRPKRSPPGRS